MANSKTGFDYTSEETGQFHDLKIKRLKRKFKGTGYAVWRYINNHIYKDKGYYVVLDEELILDVAEYWYLSEVEVIEIINYCLQIDLYNGRVFDKYSVLTSAGIQTRFLKWSEIMKRKYVKVLEKYAVSHDDESIIQEESVKLPEECEIIPEVCDVKKVSKEPERKEPDSYARDQFFEVSVLKFFGFSEMPQYYPQQKILNECCRALFSKNELQFFRQQFEGYKNYIEYIGVKFKKNFNDYLGQQSECFQDGFWRRENWAQKLIERQHAANNNIQSNRGPSAVFRADEAPIIRIKS